MAYSTTVISQFKGLSQNLALTAGAPEFSLDCINVIPSIAGLAKVRVPTDLSSAVGGTGPDQFAMFEGASTKSVLAFFGAEIYVISLDDFTPTLFDSNPDYIGPVPWSVVVSNDLAFLQNGLSTPLKYGVAASAFDYWGIQIGGTPTLGATFGTGITLSIGRKYRASYENETSGHVGTASPASASTGPITNKTQPVVIPAPAAADAQITAARLYATLDGGNDYFFHSLQPGPFPIVVSDATPDTGIDQGERAPLINNEPPRCKFMCLWGSRIFMFNLIDESSKWIAYTGYNRIFVGRPEESCPPGNRIKLEIGADEIAGGGVIPAGVVAFDRSNKMFMFRGQPEDVTVDAPVEFTLYMQQLPWQIGCASHFTIQSTRRGLVWLSTDLDVLIFDGQAAPQSISEGVQPILRTVAVDQMWNSRAVYWSYKGRNWYVLAVQTGNASALNKILVFDLEDNAEKNVGCFPIDIGEFQSLGLVEMVDGSQKLVVGQGGKLKELKVTSTTKNGIEETVTSTDGSLGAYWQSGYIGNDTPQQEKFFRYARIVADNNGILVKRRLIRDDVTSPAIMEFEDVPVGGKLSTNKKARRLSYELRFRDEDTSQNILELTDVSIPVAVR